MPGPYRAAMQASMIAVSRALRDDPAMGHIRVDRRTAARYALAVLLLAGCGLALMRVRDEARILQTERRAFAIAQGGEDAVVGRAWLASRCAAGCDPREDMAVATAELMLADGAADARSRRDLTQRAVERLRRLSIRPATRAVAWARLAAVSGDAGTLAQSYAAAPYLHGDAPVRLRVALAVWPRLDAATRAAALGEATWFARLDNERGAYVDRLFAGHAAEVAYRLRRPVAESERP